MSPADPSTAAITGRGAVIASVETFHVPVPFRRDFVLGSGPVGAAGALGDVVFVRIETSDGTVGWGEQRALPSWSYETARTIMDVIHHDLAPLLQGLTPFDVELFHRRASTALSPSVSNGFPFARAAIDVALHDAAGHLAGLPVHQLLGGRIADRIPLCSAIGVGPTEVVAEHARDSREYHAFKVKVRGDLEADRASILAVVEEAGGKPIWLDANQSYRPSQLLRLARALEDIPSVQCIEQPVPSTDWAGMRRLRRDLTLPLAIDEGSFTATDLARSAHLEAADMVVIKVCKSGGLRAAQRTAAVAQAHGIEILASGLTDCGIGFAAALHLFSAMDLALPAELNGPELLAELYVEGLDITGAVATVPRGPGLGVRVDEERIRGTALATASARVSG
ncbi:muconate cycloisomerase [Brachybacterium vulturis]|uniref:Muconate cycloisomerase n=1 Tax=Brachybacterium vulturis TaxID=2017484 RepID=A0A291GLD5_9MICO|nr:enolase C-terminal domain-like protein [Brachybacterium vulturis]ATG50774.1 muconate cycloisomerase [Brachybacterium vulturis]